MSTPIGPALAALMSWVGSLPTAEVWAGHYEPVEEWPARPYEPDAGRGRVMPSGRRETDQTAQQARSRTEGES